MNRKRIIVPLVAFTVFSFQTVASSQPEEARPPGSEAKPDLLDGLPYDEAVEFVARETGALRSVPGVEVVSVGVDAIYVSTDQPARVPATFQGIPVKTMPLTRPHIQGRSYAEIDATLERAQRDLGPLPGVQHVTLGADGLHVFTDQPELLPEEMEGLPIKTSPFMGPSINDILPSVVDAIFWRNRDALLERPGAQHVSMGPDAFYVYTDQPDQLPKEVEGIPVKAIKVSPRSDVASSRP